VKKTIWALIPARFGSTRLPGKPLRIIAEKPLIQWVWEAADGSKSISRTIIATDDERIAAIAAEFGAESVMTDPKHASGTDRIAEVIMNTYPAERPDYVVNIQGDEPLLTAGILDEFLDRFVDSGQSIGTIIAPAQRRDIDDPSKVKVVVDRHGDAIFFSRSKIPFDRDGKGNVDYLKHVGIYAFKTHALMDFTKLEPTPLERIEKLEQLRVLEHGRTIRCIEIEAAAGLIGVDTEADIVEVESALSKRN